MSARRRLVVSLAAMAVLVVAATAAFAVPDRTAKSEAAMSAASELAPGLSASLRVAGGNRYETAAEVSALAWQSPETIAVYLATGEGFADALSTGASTWHQGPVLLAARDTLPAAAIAELERLRPCYIITVGGTVAISDAVRVQAETYADPAACGGE